MFEIKNLSHNYGSLPVINDISLTVQEDEFISIIGPSGCGKTTLLNILGGLLTPSKGLVSVRGGSLDMAVKRRDFGFVFQNPVLLPWRTVLQNVELPLEIIKDDTSAQEVEKLLKLLGLSKFESYYPTALSGGMKQRVALARALVFNPDILLMDEPFGALDEIIRERLNTELLKIWQEKRKTIIFVTHSIAEAVFLSQKVVVLSGRPTTVTGVRDIDLPYPRTDNTRQTKEYFDHILWLRGQLKE